MSQTTEDLKKSIQERSAVIDSISELVAYQDTHMRILWTNRAAGDSVGVDPQQLVGRHCYEIWQQRDRPCVGCPVIKTRKSGLPQETEITSPDGKVWLIHSYPVRDKKGIVTGIVEVTLDITDRRQANEMLRDERNKAQKYLDIAEVMLIALNKKGEITLINKKGSHILGYDEEELNGKNWFTTCLPTAFRKEVKSVFLKLMEGEVDIVEFYENPVLTKAGAERMIAWHNVILKDTRGNPIGTLSSGEDITERKQAEEQLRRRTHDLGERVKELNCLSKTSELMVEPDKSLDEIYQTIVHLIPPAWQYTDITCARITYGDRQFKTDNFKETEWKQSADIIVNSNKVGSLDVCYLQKKPEEHEGPFLKEERILINALAKEIEEFIKRKEAEERLRESEERYKKLFDEAVVGICLGDAETRIIIDCNEAMAALVGREKTEVIGKLQKILHPTQDDKELFSPTFKQHLTDKEGQILETQVITKSGDIREVEIKANLLNLQGKKILQALFYDIADRKQAEEKLRDSRHMLQTVLDSIPSAVFWKDRDSRYLGGNRTWLKAAGLKSSEEVVGKSDYDLPWGKKQADSFRETDRRVMETGIPESGIIESYLRADGTQAWAMTNKVPLRDVEGNVIGVLGTYEDITERKQAEEALQDSEARFRTLFEAIPDTVLVHNDKGTIIHINEIGSQQLEWPAKELIGRNLREIVTPENAALIADHIKETHKVGWSRFETTYVSRNGWRTIAEVNEHPISFDKEKVILSVARDITERKEAEKALLKEKNFSEAVINSSPGLLFVIDNKGNAIQWNKKVEMVTGHSASEISKMNIFAFVSQDDNKTVAEAIQKALTSGQASIETNVLAKSGKKLPFYIIGRRAKIGDTTCVVCTGMNISALKQAEKELRESEERFRTFADEVSSEGLVIHDKGKILDVNRQFAKMHGYETSELFEIDTFTAVAPESRDLVLKHIQEGSETPYEAIALRKDGSRFPMEIRAKKIPYHGKMVRATAIRDITERKQAEEALRASEERFRQFFENEPTYCYMFSPEGIIIDVNNAALSTLGYTKKELVGKPLTMIYAPESLPKMEQLFTQWKQAGELKNEEMIIITKNGEKRTVLLNADAIQDANGKFLYSTSVQNDITDRKKAAEELQESYKQLQRTFTTTVNALASTVEMKDQYTAGHQPRVTRLASAIAEEVGLSQKQIEGIRMAGLIHDIGKIIVPAEILNKPGPLTDIQYEMVKMHPRAGFDILKGIKFPWPVAQIIFQHHELMDGSGYPQGLAGDQIMLEARVLTVANVVEAMTSHRPYRAAHDITAALDEIKKHKGVLYDPDVVDACLRLFNEKGFTLDTLQEPATPPIVS